MAHYFFPLAHKQDIPQNNTATVTGADYSEFAPKKGLTTAGRDAIIISVQGRLAQLVRAPR